MGTLMPVEKVLGPNQNNLENDEDCNHIPEI